MDKPEPISIRRSVSYRIWFSSRGLGGDVPCLPISAVKNEGIADLLEYVILQADILELKSKSNREAKGTIIESKLDKGGRGPVAAVLVQNGTLHLGDVVVAGTSVRKGQGYGR